MMSKIATQVMSNQSSKGLWEVVQQILGVQNKVETNYLKRLFQQTRKGSLKMEEYLSTMKKYDGDLALAKNQSPTMILSLKHYLASMKSITQLWWLSKESEELAGLIYNKTLFHMKNALNIKQP